MNFREQLARADERIQHGSDERTAGADERAHVIDAEVTRRGRGGIGSVAEELGVSEKTIHQARARARAAGERRSTLPYDTLDRLLAAELADVPALPAAYWEALAWLVRGTVIDATWVEQPGTLLSHELDATEPGEIGDADKLAAACRSWSRTQALAVIGACLAGDLDSLPTR